MHSLRWWRVNIIGYCRVSTQEQADSGLGLAAQRTALTAESTRRGWNLTLIEDEGYSAKSLNRPGIRKALAMLANGEVDGLAVARLDRLSRSVLDFANTVALSNKQGWSLALLDLGVDTATPNGKLVAGLMSQIAEWEREIIGARTRLALAEARSRGTRLGRPRRIDPPLLARIVDLKTTGHSHRAIAATLTAEGVSTPTGLSRWHHGSIAGYLDSAALDPPTVDVEPSESTARRRKKAS